LEKGKQACQVAAALHAEVERLHSDVVSLRVELAQAKVRGSKDKF
jgi:hypothetical protein